MAGPGNKPVNPEPRQREEYSKRQVEAAHRVLVDVGQVLASFADSLVVVGGWVPDLLLPDAEEEHIGSIDVDLALDAAKLNEGRYAELLKLLLDTRCYSKGEKDFQLVVQVDLEDGEGPVQVEVEFLAPKDVKLSRNKPKLLSDFRVLQTEACGVAFHAPVEVRVSGQTLRGAENTVRVRVAALPDFLVMKTHAIAGRDKPKDSYDLCYCLEHHPGGLKTLAADWKHRLEDKNVAKAVAILHEKFAGVKAFGPQQVVEFLNPSSVEERQMASRRAFELVRAFLQGIA
jgi:nucleotidyltransferase AbiEii toxin of type IV toxin-antitoxin system